jgi:hypothetical protein
MQIFFKLSFRQVLNAKKNWQINLNLYEQESEKMRFTIFTHITNGGLALVKCTMGTLGFGRNSEFS